MYIFILCLKQMYMFINVTLPWDQLLVITACCLLLADTTHSQLRLLVTTFDIIYEFYIARLNKALEH